MTEHTIPNEAPWVVEIDGIKFAAPEAVVLLLKAVSEERDALEKATDALGVKDAKTAKHMAYDLNNIPLGNALNAYANILEGKDD